MTKDEIIAIAREAGVSFGLPPDARKEQVEVVLGRLERFAKLVAEREREECAKVCEEYDGAWYVYRKGAAQCATSIRARSEK